MPYDCNVAVPQGTIRLIRGMLSDGATGVSDLCPEAFFSHDLSFLYPVTLEGKRLTKQQVDYGYYYVLKNNGHALRGIIRYVGLQYFPGTSYISSRIWSKYRLIEEAMASNYQEWLSQEHFVPRKACFQFPSIYTKDAVWIGA